jgi:hypothetical protein
VPGRLVLALLGLQLAGVVAFLVLDDVLLRSVVLSATPFQTTLAVVLATRLRRPEHAWAWYLLGSALRLRRGLGHLVPHAVRERHRRRRRLPDRLRAGGAALLGLNGLRTRRQQVAALDAALVTVGLGVLSWALVVSPATSAPGVSLTDRVISSAYPLLDALMVSLAAGLVLLGGRRTSAWLLLLWAVLQTAADTVYVFAVLAGAFAFGSPVTVVWMLGFTARPPRRCSSAGRVAPPPHGAGGRRRGGSAGILAVRHRAAARSCWSSRAVQGSLQDVVLIACGSALMTVLAVLRGTLVLTTTAPHPAALAAVRVAVLRSTAGFVVLALLPLGGLSWVAVTEARSAMTRQVEERMSVTAR